MQKKEICRVIDKNPEESNWKSNLPPLFSVEMFADSVVGLRAKLAKSKEVTELTCLNLFCARFCLAALASGCQPARGHLAGCALGWAGERLCKKKILVNSRRQEEPDSNTANREASVSWWSHFCTNKRQSSRVWVCKVHMNVWVGMVLEFDFWMD